MSFTHSARNTVQLDGDLRLRGLSEVTRAEYLRCAAHFTAYRPKKGGRWAGSADVRN